LLIASSNPGKVAEFRDLLAGSGWQVVSPADVGLALEVEESGESYAENARLKATAFGEASGLAALADDSGLEVDALDGQPGPLHHRLGWDGAGQADRIRILLEALKHVPPGRRPARFRAAICVALPDGSLLEEEGTCEGVVAGAPTGSGGFGYDPVFYLPSLGRTMAELSAAAKNRVSHRAIAVARLRPRLAALAATAAG
jgi:XTP/dITP diphosphohydrolase